MDRFIAFMQSGIGRAARIVLGLVLIFVGATMQGTAGFILGLVGVIPLIAGSAGVCFIGTFFGYTLHGDRRLRKTGSMY